jgi:adenosylmethionine-8-amino-7-oxononanoate aminotransferase
MVKKKIGNLFSRILDKPLPEAKSARGVWIEDSKGHRYLDASGGAIVVNVGHGREEIAKAVYEQILACHYVHPTMFTTRATEALASALATHSPQGLERFYFLSSGSEAVETAIKLARQIHSANGRPQRFRLVARWKSYHGLTLGALSAMGRTAFRVPYAPLLSDAVHIPPPYCLRCSFGLSYPACDLRCALAFAETIENVGPDIVSAFIAETVSGGTLAAYPPPEGYFKIIRQICDQYRVLLIMDEVMCGMGRTGQWFACQHYDVIPDIITIGKGIAGGVLALSAVGVRSEHYDAVRKAEGGFMHGGTFSHHPVAAAAGLATIGILEKENLIGRVARLGSNLGVKLKERLADHPNVADVRGIGFLWGVELVKEKNGNTPFPRQEKVAERVWDALFQKGVLVYKSTGLAGTDGDAFLVAPPFVISEDELTFVADTIKTALEEVLD